MKTRTLVLLMAAFLPLAGCDLFGPEESVTGTYDVEAHAAGASFEGAVHIDSVTGGAVYGYWVVDGYQRDTQQAWKIGVTDGEGRELTLIAIGYYTTFHATHTALRSGDDLECVRYVYSVAVEDNEEGTCTLEKWR